MSCTMGEDSEYSFAGLFTSAMSVVHRPVRLPGWTTHSFQYCFSQPCRHQHIIPIADVYCARFDRLLTEFASVGNGPGRQVVSEETGAEEGAFRR